MILIVDDDPAITTLLKLSFELEGHVVRTASTPSLTGVAPAVLEQPDTFQLPAEKGTEQYAPLWIRKLALARRREINRA